MIEVCLLESALREDGVHRKAEEMELQGSGVLLDATLRAQQIVMHADVTH